MSERNVWGFWDCSYCGNKHIRGDNDSCPSCGHRRDANVRFYLDKDNIVEVSADKKSDKANWICAFCGNQNAADLQSCASCGASKDTASGDYFHHDDEPDEFSSPSSYSEPPVFDRSEPFSITRSRVLDKQKLRKIAKIAIPIMLVVALVVGIVSFVKWFNEPVEKKITINSVSWERSIDIEELRTHKESDWSLPPNARLLYTQTEIQTYEKVFDHYETRTRTTTTQSLVGYEERIVGYDDLGNGQFRERTERVPEYTTVYSTETYQEEIYRDDPVFGTKYYYEIDRWEKSRSVDTSGYDKNPYWGKVTLRNKERRSTEHASYYISGVFDEKTQHFKLNLSDWQKYNVGDTVKLTVKRGNNHVISIDGLTTNTE